MGVYTGRASLLENEVVEEEVIENLLESVEEKVYESMSINTIAVQIMAESAYNDVLINESLSQVIESEYLTEAEAGGGIKKIFKYIKEAILNFAKKIKGIFNTLFKRSAENRSATKKKAWESRKRFTGKKAKVAEDVYNGIMDLNLDQELNVKDYSMYTYTFSFQSAFDINNVFKQFTKSDNYNTKVRDYQKMANGKISGQEISEYTNNAFKNTAINSIKSANGFSGLVRRISNCETREDIISSVASLEDYIADITLSTTKEAVEKFGEKALDNILSISELKKQYSNEEKLLNKYLKQISDVEKDIEKIINGDEAKVGDIALSLKTKKATVDASLKALSKCVTDIISYLCALNKTIIQVDAHINSTAITVYKAIDKAISSYKA